MEFKTKRELLRYLGKNPNDNKLVDRMLVRGEVVRVNRLYVYDTKEMVLGTKIEELEKENRSLRERVSELEYELENADSGGDRKMAEKIYNFLVYQCHMDIDKTEFMEAIGF